MGRQVALDQHVRELSEEMKCLLLENLQLRGVPAAAAAADGDLHARAAELEKDIESARRQVVVAVSWTKPLPWNEAWRCMCG